MKCNCQNYMEPATQTIGLQGKQSLPFLPNLLYSQSGGALLGRECKITILRLSLRTFLFPESSLMISQLGRWLHFPAPNSDSVSDNGCLSARHFNEKNYSANCLFLSASDLLHEIQKTGKWNMNVGVLYELQENQMFLNSVFMWNFIFSV